MLSRLNKSSSRHGLEQEIRQLSHALASLQERLAEESRHELDQVHHQARTLWREADDCGRQLASSGREAGRLACQTLRQHPITTLAVTAGAMAVLGYLASRRWN